MSLDPRPDILDALPAHEAAPPSIAYPPPQRVSRPFPLHPNFWWALLWCVAMLLLTQVLGGVVAIVIVILAALVNPEIAPLDRMGNPAELMQLPVFQFAIGLGLWLAHFLMILLSLLVLRIVAGRSWAREVAVRRPAALHVGLVVALVPAFYLLANGAYALTEVIGIPSAGDLVNAAAFLAALFITIFGMGAAHLFLCVAVGFDWTQRVWSRSAVGFSAALLLAFFGLTTVLYLGLSALGTYLFPPPENPATSGMEEMMKMIAAWPLPLAVFIIGVMPGFSEELWCRAYLGRGLVGKHGYFWGVLMTSFLFGVIHLDPRQGTMACVLGLVLHYVYLTTRSLWLPMLLHFCNNSLAVVLSRLSHPVADLEKNTAAVPWFLFVCAGLLLAAVLSALYRTRARLVAPEGVHPWQPPYPGVACPPPESHTAVVTPRASLGTIAAVLLALGAFGASAVVALQVRP
jgi:membrane protease YdiL (CAAX protease family)